MSRNNWTNDKLFERLLNNKSTDTYRDNIKALWSRPEKEVLKKCKELTRSAIPRERRIGIDVLSQLGGMDRPFGAETLALYLRILPKEKDPKVLESLLHAIGHNNTGLENKDIDQLSSLKKHSYAVVRFGLVFALNGIDKPVAIDTLIHLSSDKDTDIRNWATFALGEQISRNNKAIRDALWARVDDQDEDTRLEAVMGLARRKDPRVYDVITRELANGEAGTLLFDAIAVLGSADFLSALEKLQQKSAKDDSIHPSWRLKLQETIDALKS
ncbi:HEAT repeat domain-containing protein [Chitinophaga sp. S165]|uniref:HEAT repeat domain-containing protein n=1 Tax=Chitinophaga sp. S165 TaxID=2135462 RepID=UPI000D710505|nr:HEAT repeat domain-containing protein [Chitinophaga sp. S165]PWV56357.1 HEAT repeat protein [Chitinophaga sp. S165]